MSQPRISRRQVMHLALAAASAGVAGPLSAGQRPAKVSFINDPFTLGVAS